MKPIFFSLLMIACLAAAPSGAQAATVEMSATAVSQRVVLLEQIQRLLVEVIRLQALLTEQRNREVSPLPGYSIAARDYESIYQVSDGVLKTSNGQKVVGTYQSLFDLFVSVVGRDRVRAQLKEWRIFYEPEVDIGGFVLLEPGSTQWIVGINSAGYEPNNDSITRSFVDLYIHEYAHILQYEQPEFMNQYEVKFWRSLDAQHAAATQPLHGEERFNQLLSYYEKNRDWFVSDYATLSVDEDFAETFVTFVISDQPTGDTAREQKIRSFYTSPVLVSERAQLRERVARFGVLR